MTVNWLDLDTPPHLTALYAHAASKRKITGDTLPDKGLRCWVAVDAKPLEAFREVCDLPASSLLPPTYPHILAFGLQMQLLTDQAFPFPLLGLILSVSSQRAYGPDFVVRLLRGMVWR